MNVLVHQLCIRQTGMFPSNCNFVKRWWDEQTWTRIECGVNCSNGQHLESLECEGDFCASDCYKSSCKAKATVWKSVSYWSCCSLISDPSTLMAWNEKGKKDKMASFHIVHRKKVGIWPPCGQMHSKCCGDTKLFRGNG